MGNMGDTWTSSPDQEQTEHETQLNTHILLLLLYILDISLGHYLDEKQMSGFVSAIQKYMPNIFLCL